MTQYDRWKLDTPPYLEDTEEEEEQEETEEEESDED
jgi:hypothetical protein